MSATSGPQTGGDVSQVSAALLFGLACLALWALYGVTVHVVFYSQTGHAAVDASGNHLAAVVSTVLMGFGVVMWFAYNQGDRRPDLGHASRLERAVFLVPLYGYGSLKGLAGGDLRVQRKLMQRHLAWFGFLVANGFLIGGVRTARVAAIPLAAAFFAAEVGLLLLSQRLFPFVRFAPAAQTEVTPAAGITPRAAPAIDGVRVRDVAALPRLAWTVNRLGLVEAGGVGVVAAVGVAAPGSHASTLSLVLTTVPPFVVTVVAVGLLRRGRLGVATLAVVAAMSGVAIVIGKLAVGDRPGAGEALVVLAVVALLTARYMRRYFRACQAARVPAWRPVRIARVPSLLWGDLHGASLVRRNPAAALLQLVVGAAVAIGAFYFVLINTAANVLPVLSDLVADYLTHGFRRARLAVMNATTRLAHPRDTRVLAFVAPRDGDRVSISVRADPLRWGLLTRASVPFQDFVREQLWLYGTPAPARAGPPGATASRNTEAAAVVVADADLPEAALTTAPAQADRFLCVFPPDPPATMRAAAARVGGPVDAAVAQLDDSQLSRLLAVAGGSGVTVTLWVGPGRTEWDYIAALDDAAVLLSLVS